jgi:hypothetical protein
MTTTTPDRVETRAWFYKNQWVALLPPREGRLTLVDGLLSFCTTTKETLFEHPVADLRFTFSPIQFGFAFRHGATRPFVSFATKNTISLRRGWSDYKRWRGLLEERSQREAIAGPIGTDEGPVKDRQPAVTRNA